MACHCILRGADVLAFQRLWNRNHPGDAIDEDGLYGPAVDNDFATNKWVYLYYAPPKVTIAT